MALPRLQPGQKAERKTREVDLPDLGASVVIQVPGVGAVQEIQAQADKLTELEYAQALCAISLVEPDMTADEFKEAVSEWPVSDWMILQQEVLDLAGMGKAALEAAQKRFRNPGD